MKPILVSSKSISTIVAGATVAIISLASPVLSAGNDGSTFAYTLSNGMDFDQDSDGFSVVEAGNDAWQFGMRFGALLILEGKSLDDAPVTRTEDIGEGGYGDRDLRVYFWDDVAGVRTLIHCQSAKQGSGWIERTALSETHVSGRFSIEATECFDRSGAPVAYSPLPFTVSGEFSVGICGLFQREKC